MYVFGIIMSLLGALGLRSLLRRLKTLASGDDPNVRGSIDQVAAVGSRRPPPPDVQSAVIPPHRLVYVRGWAIGPAGTSFAIELNDRSVECSTNIPRPDVAKAVGKADAETAGFEAFLETPIQEGGISRIKLSARSGSQFKTLDERAIRTADPRPRTTLHPVNGGFLHVDRMWAGTRPLDPKARGIVVTADELLTIEGWAIGEFERRAGIAAYALLDDRDAIPMSYGSKRDDVAAAYDTPDVRFSGFRARIDPAPYVGSSQRLRIVVLMDDGSALSCADTFALVVDN